MSEWVIMLYGIKWDDGKGEYDVSALPKNLQVSVEADTETEAIEIALGEASDDFGSLIDSTTQIVVTRE